MSFAAAAFLLGFGALALPWWLHRRHSHRATPRVVASLQFMQPSDTPAQRQRVVRRRVLLACRWLLLAVLVLAFAQPLLERAAGAVLPAATLPRLIVLDTSLSMSGSFGAAQEAALSLIDRLPAGVSGAVVGAAAELTVLAPLQDDHAALRAAVASADPDAERLALDGLLGRLAGLAASLSAEPLEIHLVSDFQRTAVPVHFNALLAPLDYPVVLHPVSGAEANLQIAAVSVAERIDVRVRSFATSSEQAELIAEIGGSEVARQTLQLAPGGTASAAFDGPAGLAAGGAVTVRLATADARPADDTRYAVVNALQTQPLPLFVGAGAGGQAAYLRTAMDAAAVRFRTAPPDTRARVALVVDPGGLDAAARRRLAEHVERGGSLLVTAGPATRDSGGLQAPELALTASRLPRATSGVTVLDRSHPALGPVAAWREVQVFQHVVAEQRVGATALLAADDGTPLLLELALPGGRALLLTTALDPQWSTLVASPVFVQFVADALTFLAEDLVPEQAIAGQAVAVPATSLQVFDANGVRQLALQETVGRSSGLRLSQPGVYTLRTPDRSRLLAVNPDPRESDPTPAAPELLARWQAAVNRAAPQPADPLAAPPAGSLPLAPWLLLVLLGLAVLEPLAANFGREAA